MSAVGQCAVCQTARKGMNRVGGLDVCDVCFQGGAGQAVLKRGWQLDARSWVRRTRDATFYYCEATGVMAVKAPIQARFRMKAGFWMLPAMFFGINTDDPLFNRLVYASSSTAKATSAFLESEGAQSAVMDLVGEQAIITVSGSSVKAYAMSSGDVPDEARIESEVAVLMAHLETFGAVHGG